MSRIPQDVVEAGVLDGLTTLKEWWYITLPCTLPYIGTMYLLSVLGIFNAGGQALLLTGGAYGTFDLPYYEYTLTVGGTSQDQAIGGAMGLIKSIAVFPLAIIMNRIVDKIEAVEF